jgi:hypothetical protein
VLLVTGAVVLPKVNRHLAELVSVKLMVEGWPMGLPPSQLDKQTRVAVAQMDPQAVLVWWLWGTWHEFNRHLLGIGSQPLRNFYCAWHLD